jgi:hypothetical protein
MQEAELFYQFLRLPDVWSQQAVEIKDSKLDGQQAAAVLQTQHTHKRDVPQASRAALCQSGFFGRDLPHHSHMSI